MLLVRGKCWPDYSSLLIAPQCYPVPCTSWLYLQCIWAGPGPSVRSASVCPCLAPLPLPPPLQSALCWSWADTSWGQTAARAGWARLLLAPCLVPAGCLARSLSAGPGPGPGHCPPDTRLACDVILPPRLSQLESAPCLQQTRASHKPVYCDPCVQHTPAGCSQTLSGAAAPAVISWISVIQAT